jgi:hypothetical protein
MIPRSCLVTLTQQDNELVQLPKTSMIWINSLVQPLVISNGKIPTHTRLKSALRGPYSLHYRCQSRHFFIFPGGIVISKPARLPYIYSAGPHSFSPNNLRLSSRQENLSLNTKVCDLNCAVYFSFHQVA